MRLVTILFIAILTLTSPSYADAKDQGPFHYEFAELAPGVWVGIRPNSSRFPVMGNATFVIGDDGVLVFDGGGAPGMADQVVEKIKTLTDNPVTHVVISHWHGDHHFGIHRIKDAYPDAEIVAHDFTARAMDSDRIDYVDRLPTAIERNMPQFLQMREDDVDFDGSPLTDVSRKNLEQMIADAPLVDIEYKNSELTPPTMVVGDETSISLGGRTVDLLYLGQGNTEGDLVMWLPDERIAAAGDLIVYPSPYAFNVPPRAWASTLTRLNALGYEQLVPGHGAVQNTTDYVDLVIEATTSIADQRDAMVADGVAEEEIPENLDFTSFEERFTGGDPYKKIFYHAYFERPLRAAAMKELTGGPMVELKPRAQPELTD